MNNTPNRDEVLTKIKQQTINLLKLPSAGVQPESRLQEDLGVDSLFMTQLILALEDEFDIELDATDTVHFATINSTADYIVSQLEAN